MNAAHIIQVAADFFGVRPCDLIGPGRHKSKIMRRHITMAVCRERLEMSFAEIAQEFGGRDHTTCMSAIKRARKMRETSQAWADAFSGLEHALLGWREEREIERLEMGA